MAKKLAGVDSSMIGASARDVAPAVASPAPKAERVPSASESNLSFKVSAEFRRRFRTYAAEHDMKLNELLPIAFEALLRETRSV